MHETGNGTLMECAEELESFNYIHGFYVSPITGKQCLEGHVPGFLAKPMLTIVTLRVVVSL